MSKPLINVIFPVFCRPGGKRRVEASGGFATDLKEEPRPLSGCLIPGTSDPSSSTAQTHTTTPHTLTHAPHNKRHTHAHRVHPKDVVGMPRGGSRGLWTLQPTGRGRRNRTPGYPRYPRIPGPSTGQFSVGVPPVNVPGSGSLRPSLHSSLHHPAHPTSQGGSPPERVRAKPGGSGRC